MRWRARHPCLRPCHMHTGRFGARRARPPVSPGMLQTTPHNGRRNKHLAHNIRKRAICADAVQLNEQPVDRTVLMRGLQTAGRSRGIPHRMFQTLARARQRGLNGPQIACHLMGESTRSIETPRLMVSPLIRKLTARSTFPVPFRSRLLTTCVASSGLTCERSHQVDHVLRQVHHGARSDRKGDNVSQSPLRRGRTIITVIRAKPATLVWPGMERHDPRFSPLALLFRIIPTP